MQLIYENYTSNGVKEQIYPAICDKSSLIPGPMVVVSVAFLIFAGPMA